MLSLSPGYLVETLEVVESEYIEDSQEENDEIRIWPIGTDPALCL